MVRPLEVDNRKTVGLNFAETEAIGEYSKKAGIELGPLFPLRSGPRSRDFGESSYERDGDVSTHNEISVTTAWFDAHG